jgi:pimeloyl-ACP methyl ester carboxylesterase
MPLALNSVTWGPGTPTVLMLHGLGDGAFVWDHIAPLLATRTTVTAIDLRGHGDSPHDSEARYDIDAYVEDVLQAFNSRFNGHQVILIGHSLGAEVAIHVASRAREQVRGLTLLDGGPWLNSSAVRHIRDQFLTQPWFHHSVDLFAAELQRRHPLADLQILQRIADRALRPLASGGYELKCDRQLLSAVSDFDDALLWEKLRSFGGPVLVIRGAASAVLSRSSAARVIDKLPDCRLHTVPMAGHAVMLDNPTELLDALKRFLSEISADGQDVVLRPSRSQTSFRSRT